jgi:hypothetical protein
MNIEMIAATENGNGNGNGHKKAFEIGPVKTPEQIQAEQTRKIAPEIRRSVHFSRLPAAAKFFYAALLDLSFLHCYGGSGRGKIFITVRDLSRLLKHHKDSIGLWRDMLIEARLIWVREGWPKSEWRICALCPPPETDYKLGEYQTILGRAAALAPDSPEGETVLQSSHTSFLPKNGDSPRISEGNGHTEPENPPTRAGSVGQRVLDSRPACPREQATKGRFSRTLEPAPQDKVSQDPGPLCPKPPATRGQTSGSNKESPRSIGGTGDSKCVAPGVKSGVTHTVPVFEELDSRTFARLRPKQGEEMIEFCKQRIYAVEQSRTPVLNRAEIIVAYKQRIKAVKNWMAGQL